MSAPVSNKAQKVISSGGSSLSDFLNTVNTIKGTDAAQSLSAGLFGVKSSAVFKEQSGIAFFVSFPRSPSLGSFEVKALEIFRLPICKSSVCLPLHFTHGDFLEQYFARWRSRPEVTNMRPAGRMQPAKEFPAAREHFGETSTFNIFSPSNLCDAIPKAEPLI